MQKQNSFSRVFFLMKKMQNRKINSFPRDNQPIKFSIMSFERDNKSWSQDNQPIRLLLMT